MDRTCSKCGKEFAKPYLLKRHSERKTSCEPIVAARAESNTIQCKYCGRPFASEASMTRHIRQTCKIANSEEGMEKLVEHTLERQMAEMQTKLAAQTEQVARLAALIESQQGALTTMSSAPAPSLTVGSVTVGAMNTGVVNNTTNNIQVTIAPWDGDERIRVETSQIAAAFAQNDVLKEYSKLTNEELADPTRAPPYVVELLMDLVKRAHADPASRNVYLNPRRADQTLVHMASGRWEIVLLEVATKLMFDGVAKSMHRAVMSTAELRQLPMEAQNALSVAGLLYDEEPLEYARRAKAPMSAHLANSSQDIAPPK